VIGKGLCFPFPVLEMGQFVAVQQVELHETVHGNHGEGGGVEAEDKVNDYRHAGKVIFFLWAKVSGSMFNGTVALGHLP
jgi:hypothetical protein